MSVPKKMSRSKTVDQVLRDARSLLATAPFNPPGREATLLLGHVLGRREANLMAHGEDAVAPADEETFTNLLKRRLTGEPVAYLLGHREFYGRDFTVDPRVLIPRPETEHLIEAALAWPGLEKPRILDVGAGSGAIAITLALEIPDATVWAGDLSLDALQVLRLNIERLGVAGRVLPLRGDLATAVDLSSLDMLVANPPYVSRKVAGALSTEVVDHEPHQALFPPGESHSLIERLLVAAADLRPGTPVLIEIGYDQAEWVYEATDQKAYLELLDIRRDYGGRPRTAVLRRV